MPEVNFSERTKPRVDPHTWTERPGAIIYWPGRLPTFTRVKDITIHVCSQCGLALVVRPELQHDLPPCEQEKSSEQIS